MKNAVALNEKLAVMTRTMYLREAPALRAVGATVIVSEAEVALAMTENILVRHCAPSAQLDRAMMLAKREGAELVVLHVMEATPGNRGGFDLVVIGT